MENKTSISKISWLLCIVIMVGYVVTVLTANYGLRELQVGGPVHNRIVMVKDLIADILPPPAYVIEAYLEVTLAYQDPKSAASRKERLAQLHKDYDTRRDYWGDQDLDSGIKRLLTQKSDEHVARFWDEVEKQLLPALERGDTDRARAAYGAITEAYDAHRKVIDETVEKANSFGAATEKFATDRSNTITLLIWAVSLVVLAMIAAAAVGAIAGLVKPVALMAKAMQGLARGDLNVEFPGAQRRDEIGSMAAATQVFKDNLIQKQQMAAEQDARERKAEREKRETMKKLADEFQQKVGGVIQSLSAAANQLQASAASMSAIAQQTSNQAGSVSSSANQATGNVQTVAAAAEELSASISEIRRQVSGSAGTAKQGVQQAERTNKTIEGLVDATGKISEVVELITSIASQTNLLALNATIEAARAGEAGKGFAVVASEVKNLANQTAKATEEISRYIASIQQATNESVSALREIANIIGQIDSSTNTINHSIEEQNNATLEISRSVQQAAASTAEVSETISSVNEASAETGHAAAQVLEAAQRMSKESESLNREVQSFLAEIKA
ncbi:MAG: HAMP domain-containing methyl-accepting chemotaxis protein [Rhodospirillaceae bacterium]|nr:HAMP domain-containing methyl-accepting chemotaxis protein [Rhodospirillaceae bacterium]